MELKKAIEVLKERSEWIKKHLPESSHAKAIDTVVAELEKPTYTPADMDSFAEWCSKNKWVYDWRERKWWSINSYVSKTTAQLRGLWEDWKLAQQRGEELK